MVVVMEMESIGVEDNVYVLEDLSDKGSECEDMNNNIKYSDGSASSEESSMKKTCAGYGTTKTPLWRGGPAGPKSLCDACGIRAVRREEFSALYFFCVCCGGSSCCLRHKSFKSACNIPKSCD